MSAKTVSHLAQKSARLSSITDQHQNKLRKTLDQWFFGEFVKAMKLPLLRKIYEAGAYDVFVELLQLRSDADLVAILDKVDKYNADVQMYSTKQALVHIEQLAKGQAKPWPKPKDNSQRAGKAAPSASKKSGGVIRDSKY